MKGSWLKSAMRTLLIYVGEALMWTCVPFGMDAAVAARISVRIRARSAARLSDMRRNPDHLSMTPLSRAERTEWAELVERLR